MSSFTRFDAPLSIRYHAKSAKHNRGTWILLEGFKYYLEDEPDITVHVPAGFISDGASVPSILHWVLPPWGQYGQACVLHDYLLELGRMHDKQGKFVYCNTRTEAREHFIDAMRVLNVPKWKRDLLGFGVWLWDQFREESLR